MTVLSSVFDRDEVRRRRTRTISSVFDRDEVRRRRTRTIWPT
ncbi:MAG: hypothetical protein ACRD2C_01630 [Acidimicrobiales bacterium]